MSETKKIKPKYYSIAAESILQLLTKLNNANYQSQNTYNRELHVQQIIEPTLAPGEFYAVCYDVDLPPFMIAGA